MLAAAILLTPALFSPRTVPPKSIESRRSALAAIAAPALLAIGAPVSAIVDSTDPASNYYFPMAKYRYLPRVLRAWIAVDRRQPPAAGSGRLRLGGVARGVGEGGRRGDGHAAVHECRRGVALLKAQEEVGRTPPCCQSAHHTATHPSRSCGAGAEVNAEGDQSMLETGPPCPALSEPRGNLGRCSTLGGPAGGPFGRTYRASVSTIGDHCLQGGVR